MEFPHYILYLEQPTRQDLLHALSQDPNLILELPNPTTYGENVAVSIDPRLFKYIKNKTNTLEFIACIQSQSCVSDFEEISTFCKQFTENFFFRDLIFKDVVYGCMDSNIQMVLDYKEAISMVEQEFHYIRLNIDVSHYTKGVQIYLEQHLQFIEMKTSDCFGPFIELKRIYLSTNTNTNTTLSILNDCVDFPPEDIDSPTNVFLHYMDPNDQKQFILNMTLGFLYITLDELVSVDDILRFCQQFKKCDILR